MNAHFLIICGCSHDLHLYRLIFFCIIMSLRNYIISFISLFILVTSMHCHCALPTYIHCSVYAHIFHLIGINCWKSNCILLLSFCQMDHVEGEVVGDEEMLSIIEPLLLNQINSSFWFGLSWLPPSTLSLSNDTLATINCVVVVVHLYFRYMYVIKWRINWG